MSGSRRHFSNRTVHHSLRVLWGLPIGLDGLPGYGVFPYLLAKATMNDIVHPAPVMPAIRTIIVFGDLTYNFQKDLQQLVHIRCNANLVDFFARVAFVFRHEFASLPKLEQEWLPRFTEIADLLENVDHAEGAPAVRFALLCVYQIGRFIG